MVSSRFEVEPGIDPQVVAAVIAAVMYWYDEDRINEKPYVSRKNRGWKTLCLQENCWGRSHSRS
ncbi:MAG: hypothetical protein NTX88_11525 [Candidatus Atribacteria bacterium]|nr:hypothetical protein [Candidatus Atribacteria bacterium]